MLDLKNAAALVVDVQGRLAELMWEHQILFHNIERFIKAAQILELPILWTEQAPEKIGPTVSCISELLFPLVRPIAKASFSCWENPQFKEALYLTGRRQVVIVGIETHVCIYQTASDLYRHGYEVFVVADAVSSRTQFNRDTALTRLRQEGIVVASLESVICEYIKTAEHPQFKDIIKYLKK